MKTLLYSPLACCGLAIGLVACRVDRSVDPPRVDDGSAVDVPAAYTGNDLRADVVDALCDWFDACEGTVTNPFGGRQGCEGFEDFSLRLQLDESGNTTDPSLFGIDAEALDGCLAALRSNDCSTPPNFSEEPLCENVLVGRLGEGECCDQRRGCGPGLVCEVPTGIGDIGYCSAIGEEGETCNRQTCAPGTACIEVGSVRQCLVSLNLPPAAACERTYDCGGGLACVYSSLGYFQCLSRAQVGQYCNTPELPCENGLYCVGSAVGTCQETPGVEGDLCNFDDECGATLRCLSSTCIHEGALGETCIADDPHAPCVDGLACIAGICGEYPRPVAVGDACHPDGPECPGSFGEDICREGPLGYVCIALGGDGDPCGGVDDAPCSFATGFMCNTDVGHCERLPNEGEACTGFCADLFGLTCDQSLATPVCIKRRAIGSLCTAFEEEDLFATQCEIFSLCLPNDNDETLCTSLEDSNPDEEVCQ